MNLPDISGPEPQKFIKENANLPIEDILLKAKKFPHLNVPFLAAQIDGKNKAKKKLPSWFESNDVLYPIKLSMEQCSSETTAAYKASLVSGNLLLDLSGGFGVDCTAFSEKIKKVIYLERNKELVEIATHNFKTFHKKNIESHSIDSNEYLTTLNEVADWIFIDPARRKEGEKVFRLSDCEPNIIELQELLYKKSKAILIKTSPLLDIDLAIKELNFVTEVHVVSVDNECKELLFILDKNFNSAEPEIIAVNIKKNEKEVFRFTRKKENETEVILQFPQQYLYEPNSSILKAGAFKSIAQHYSLFKLNGSSHLYTSEILQENFPGRIFKINKTLKYSKKEIQAEITEGKANITARNFPDSVEEIRKKIGIKDGGHHYLFATKDLSNKLIILATVKI